MIFSPPLSRLLSPILFLALALSPIFSSSAAAGDAAAGATKAETCVACHGDGGNRPIADYPKLAGQARKYLLHTMRAYKSGARENAIMLQQMAPFSDQDLQDLAAYFASQPGDLH